MWQNDHQLLGIMSTVWIVWDPGDNSPSAHVVNFRAHALCPCFMKVSGRNSMWTVWITLKIPQHRKPSACASSHHLISRTCKTCLSSSKAVRCQHNPQASPGNRSRITSGALGCEFSSAEHHCDCMFLEKRWAVSKVAQSEQEWTRDLLYNQLLEETHSIKHCCMCIYIYIYIFAHHSSPQIKHSHVVHSASKNFFASSSQPSGSGSGRSSRASFNAQTDQPKSQRNGFVSTVHICKLMSSWSFPTLAFSCFFIYRFVRCYYGHLRNCMELFSMLCHHLAPWHGTFAFCSGSTTFGDFGSFSSMSSSSVCDAGDGVPGVSWISWHMWPWLFDLELNSCHAAGWGPLFYSCNLSLLSLCSLSVASIRHSHMQHTRYTNVSYHYGLSSWVGHTGQCPLVCNPCPTYTQTKSS